MYRAIISPLLCLLAVLPGLAAGSSPKPAKASYDVSYVWSQNLDAVRNYRDRVAQVLGPGVAKDLRVVAKGKLYGVIYARRGDSAGAGRVAEAHTRLLHSRGLDAAAAMRSGPWTPVDATQTVELASVTPVSVTRWAPGVTSLRTTETPPAKPLAMARSRSSS